MSARGFASGAAKGAVALLVIGTAAACNRIDHLGQAPSMTPVGGIKEQQALTTQDVVAKLPIPAPPPALPSQPGSLWLSGSQSFFYDNRASRVGDILTVLIDLDEEADFQNETTRTRAAEESLGVPGIFGYETALEELLPRAANPEALVGVTSGSTTRGIGAASRSERVQTRIAAVITAILPNGNMVISGSQEVRVNFDLRELQIAGVIRAQDVTSENTVTYDKIAEARIAYGGRGQLQDLQQPRYGQQVFDIIMPF